MEASDSCEKLHLVVRGERERENKNDSVVCFHSWMENTSESSFAHPSTNGDCLSAGANCSGQQKWYSLFHKDCTARDLKVQTSGWTAAKKSPHVRGHRDCGTPHPERHSSPPPCWLWEDAPKQNYLDVLLIEKFQLVCFPVFSFEGRLFKNRLWSC